MLHARRVSVPSINYLFLTRMYLFCPPPPICRYLPEIVDLVQRHLQEWVDAGEAGVNGLDALKMLTFEFIVQVGCGTR